MIAHLVISRLFLLLGRRRQKLPNLDLDVMVVHRVLEVLRRTDKAIDDLLDVRVADSEVAILLADSSAARKDFLRVHFVTAHRDFCSLFDGLLLPRLRVDADDIDTDAVFRLL